jgi:membrane protein implicated in regulation of membrane protease activity
MNQTRLGSFIEAWFNVLIGFGINWCANMLILPLFGFHVSGGQAFGIGVLFTVISVVRSYAIRRWFNARLQRMAQRLAGRV